MVQSRVLGRHTRRSCRLLGLTLGRERGRLLLTKILELSRKVASLLKQVVVVLRFNGTAKLSFGFLEDLGRNLLSLKFWISTVYFDSNINFVEIQTDGRRTDLRGLVVGRSLGDLSSVGADLTAS